MRAERGEVWWVLKRQDTVLFFRKENRIFLGGGKGEEDGRAEEQRLATPAFFPYDLRKKNIISESRRTSGSLAGKALQASRGTEGGLGEFDPKGGEAVAVG